MRGRWLSYLPMVLAVCVVAAAAGYLVTHPPGLPSPAPPPAGTGPTVAPGPTPAPPPTTEPAPATTPEPPAPPPAAGPFTQPPASSTPVPPANTPAAPPAPRGPAGAQLFHVQAGAFARLENAEALVRQLRAKQYSADVVKGQPYYRVWIGQPLDRPGAERLAERLRADGFETALIPGP